MKTFNFIAGLCSILSVILGLITIALDELKTRRIKERPRGLDDKTSPNKESQTTYRVVRL